MGTTHEESQQKHAEYNIWAQEMRAQGRTLPSDSGAACGYLHSDDLRAHTPTQAQRQAACDRNKPGKSTFGSFDERQIVLSKVYVTYDETAAAQRMAA